MAAHTKGVGRSSRFAGAAAGSLDADWLLIHLQFWRRMMKGSHLKRWHLSRAGPVFMSVQSSQIGLSERPCEGGGGEGRRDPNKNIRRRRKTELILKNLFPSNILCISSVSRKDQKKKKKPTLIGASVQTFFFFFFSPINFSSNILG